MNENKVPALAAARSLVNSAAKTFYDGAELRPYQGRPGAVDALNVPSRNGNELRYRDGRVEKQA